MFSHGGNFPRFVRALKRRLARYPGPPLALAGALGYMLLLPQLYTYARPPVSPEMEVALPRFAQVLMAAGDRFLAADLAVVRSLVVSTEAMPRENYQVLGRVQSDAAWFNPANEDNYYLAAAILPWYGQLDAAQYILNKASGARPFDWQPAFYYAFNEFHFRKNALKGAEWLGVAARQTADELERIQLQEMAAAWASQAQNSAMSIRLLRAMAKETRHKSFSAFLEKRAQRMENIQELTLAIEKFEKDFGRGPEHLSDLVAAQILGVIPNDPFGGSYVVDSKGRVVPQTHVLSGNGKK